MTIGQLADRLNITRQTLHAQTTGPANIASIEKIAAALQVEPWQLLHPDPASLEAPPFLAVRCPICGGRLTVTLAPAHQDQPHQDTTTDSAGPIEDNNHGQPATAQEKRKRGRPRKASSTADDGQLF